MRTKDTVDSRSDSEIDAAIHVAFDKLNLRFAELSCKTQAEVTQIYQDKLEQLTKAQKTTDVAAKSICSCCTIN
jgi:hypothetical protein